MATSPQYASTPNTTGTSFVNADGTTAKTVFTAGSNGSRLEALTACSTDTASRVITLKLVKSGTGYLLGQITCPAAGSVASILNLLDPTVLTMLDPNNVGISLKSGDTLTAAMDAAVTSAKTVDVIALGGDF